MVERQEYLHEASNQHAHQSGKQVWAKIGEIILQKQQGSVWEHKGCLATTYFGLESEQCQADENTGGDDQGLQDNSRRIVACYGPDHQALEQSKSSQENHVGGIFMSLEMYAEQCAKGTKDGKP